MKTNLEKPVTLTTQVLVTLTSLLSSYLTPEANAMYSGLKKLVEKNYSPSDSGIPVIITNTHTS